MKFIFYFIFYFFFFASALSVSAQINDKPVKLVHYVLDSFTNGTVKTKSGEVHSQLLNYNLVTQEMIFEQGGKYLAIAYPQEIEMVLINERKFVPVNNAFYEWLGGSTFPLFVEYTCTIKEQGTQTGFGTTHTTASTSFKSLIKDGAAYRLQLPDEFQVIPEFSYYIRKKRQYYKVNNELQITRLFPDKKQVIKDWIKNNHTNFSRPEELILLVEQIQ